MKVQDAKQYILNHSKDYFQKARRKGYVCPICESGSGPKGTGVTENKDGVHFTCWAGCFSNADVFQIYGQEHNTSDFMQQLKGLCDFYGLSLDERTHRPEHKQPYKTLPQETLQPAKQEADFTKFFNDANKHLKETNYHRGISLATLNRFNVGYVKGWTSPTAEKKVQSDRLIIPTSKHSYIARATDTTNPIRVMKEGPSALFNPEALADSTQPVFIVEGEIDALSIIDLGYNALGLGGLGNITKLLQEVEARQPSQPLIIALDNDEAGQRKQAELEAQKGPINAFMHFATVSTLYGKEKDANGALTANKDAFKAALEAEAIRAAQEQERLQNEVKEAYRQKNSVLAYMETFYNTLRTKPAQPIPTGFQSVDSMLDGGLFAGLYIIGAISSLGKTTFSLQIADNLAKAGQDVLIFSLEMAKRELIAKSVSRLTYIETLEQGQPNLCASTTRTVLKGLNCAAYSEIQRQNIIKSIYEYNNNYAKHIFITEGMGNVGVDEIRQQVAEFMQIYKKSPVVIVDYLQILAPADVKASDKQNTDKAVLELKRLSRDFNIPILGISSFNRANYTAPVNLASFKESGAIEYSSDVLIGLQYEGMDYQNGDTEKNRPARIRDLMTHNEELARKGQPVKIEANILKSRNGSKGKAVLQFVPMFNCFIDEQQTPTDEAPEASGLF